VQTNGKQVIHHQKQTQDQGMKHSFFRQSPFNFWLLIVLLVLVTTAVVPIAGLAHTAQDNNQEASHSTPADTSGVISARESSIEWTSSQEPWTPARMEAAEPYPIPSNEFSNLTTVNPPQPSRDPTYIPSEAPEKFSPASQGEEIPGIFSAESLLGYNYPAPYTRFENFDNYTVFPYSTTGVLFFTQNGKDFRCSAASIGNNALWTAGHCVHDGNTGEIGWSENVVFVPAYKNGNMPFGFWTYTDVATSSAWFENEDYRYDFGGVLLEENASGKTVNEVVGSLGFAFNLHTNQHWFNLGFPVVTPFDGKTMQICAASFARNDPSFTFPSPIAIGCDMTGGSSGGPWIIDFSGVDGNTNYINGNNSYRYTGFGEEMYSPYLGEQAKELLDYLSSETRIKTNIHIPIVISNH
jgi:V8-like Glu-specific endopeptidase